VAFCVILVFAFEISNGLNDTANPADCHTGGYLLGGG
jgi:hypothetical protein